MPNGEDLADLKQIEALFQRDDADEHTLHLLGPNREEIPISLSMVQVLHEVADALAQDYAVAVILLHKMLTTPQAADVLNVFRQYLVCLLDEGRIASSKTGTQRRMRFDDLLADMSQEIELLLD